MLDIREQYWWHRAQSHLLWPCPRQWLYAKILSAPNSQTAQLVRLNWQLYAIICQDLCGGPGRRRPCQTTWTSPKRRSSNCWRRKILSLQAKRTTTRRLSNYSSGGHRSTRFQLFASRLENCTNRWVSQSKARARKDSWDPWDALICWQTWSSDSKKSDERPQPARQHPRSPWCRQEYMLRVWKSWWFVVHGQI